MLLILRRDGSDVVKIEPEALGVTQKSRQQLETTYVGCDLVSAEGYTQEILGFDIGDRIGYARWLSWLSLTGRRELTVRLGPKRDISTDELRIPLLKYLGSEARVDEWADSTEAMRRLLDCVAGATDVPEVFRCIQSAGPVEHLDVLV